MTVVGIISEGRLVARSIQPRPLAHDAVPPTISLSGSIKGIRLNEDGVVSRIIVTGVVVVINSETRVEGVLRIDVPVKLTGVRRGDLLVAIVVISAEVDGPRPTRTRMVQQTASRGGPSSEEKWSRCFVIGRAYSKLCESTG